MTDSKSLSQERFNQYAQRYVTSQTHAKGSELDLLLEMAQPQPDWVVLDVATGGGHTALKFAPQVARVIASDLTPNMLAAAEKHITEQGITNVEFNLADAENLPFDAETFDLVTCRIAPHHFPDAARFVRESVRVLKSGGMLLVQDQMLPEDADAACYADNFEKLRDPSHNRAFNEGQWRMMFEAAGLTIERAATVIKRHDLHNWARMQGNPPELVEQLHILLKLAPEVVQDWMQPLDLDTPQASFVNHHLLLAGRK